MKITCQSCQAKYTIADDKVLGKIVKIRCKKCSATIVVNGSDPSSRASRPESMDDAGQGAQPQDDAWTVNLAEGDQRTLTGPEIVAAYQAGIVQDETLCWKDGMSDWLPLREIDLLYDACGATNALAAPPRIQPSAPVSVGRGVSSARPPAGMPAAANGSGNLVAAAPAVARRTGGRAPAADLFSGAAHAGSEEDVMTSAPVGMPQAHEDPQKLTGQRNENSVLFSLNALTSKSASERPPPIPGVEASGLIDIRQLSAQMGTEDAKKKSRIDDIMNLSSGGGFQAALAAPSFVAPSIEDYAQAEGVGPPPGKSRWLIYAALLAGVFVVVGAIGAAVVTMRGKGDTEKEAASASAAALAAAPSASEMAASDSPAPAASASAAAPVASAASKEASKPSGTKTGSAAAAAAAATAPAATSNLPKDTSLGAAMAAAAVAPTATKAAAPAGESDQAFNMGEAKSRLAAAAAAAQSCKKADGPSGTGRAVVLFAPSGAAQSATITGPPFEGTPTGACVAARFRGVHVPPFGGSPFSVSKSFTIN